jgi:hypothetical protein
MVNSGMVYFLSRPRQFGKSVLISTLEALFRGRKELFKGLYIYDKWDWTWLYPVIYIDLGKRSFDSPEDLKNSLKEVFDDVADEHQISLQERSLNGRLGELIRKLHKSTGQQVVVLIDDYDKPITDHLMDKETLKDFENIFHNVYSVLKSSNEHTEFILLTGESSFLGQWTFQSVNNALDITFNWEYVALCGYTQEELEYYFNDYIDAFAERESISRNELLDKIKLRYNGYSWDGETYVYNPHSILSLFENGEFGDYWVRSKTPTFLIELLKKRNQISLLMELLQIDLHSFEYYVPEYPLEIPLLFQTGYLTIKQPIDRSLNWPLYILGMPNDEVKISFLEHLLNACTEYPLEQIQTLVKDMQKQIYNVETSALEQNLRTLLTNVPNTPQVPEERYSYSLLMLLMKLLGFDIQGEILTNIGRIDVVWRQPGLTVVGEIKYHAEKDLDALLNEAMTQIHDRKYYEAYLDRKVTLMAIAFTGKKVKCELKKL